MPSNDELPWWELEGRPAPHDAHFDEEAERLWQWRARQYGEKIRRRDGKRADSSVAPPPNPQANTDG
jgi:hypothetical protein